MRLTLPLLSKAARSSKTATATLESYLSSLKATQLKSLARATGIPNSGRKDELRQKISEELLTSIFLCDAGHHDSPQKKKEGMGLCGKELSILSIDMGIQNLAFAHLIVRPPDHLRGIGDGVEKGLVTLNAWHRIGVQELGCASPASRDADTTEVKLQSLLSPSAFRTFKKPSSEESDDIESDQNLPTDSKPANKNFEPDTLSHNAFFLLSSLLQAYKPTHILIERQRFRSAGQSAVLEWSLRVGVFEGMLHAVLCTMRELSRLSKRHGGIGGVADHLQVYAISPARIMQFWDEGKSDTSLEEGDDDGGKKAKSQNQRGVKRFKMDVVGDLLSASTTGTSGRENLSCWDVAVDIKDKDEQGVPGVKDVVDAYLRRWNPQLSVSQTELKSGTSTKKGRKGKSATDDKKAYQIDKMDDLADCLLQGLTWLEWQARRARIVRGRAVDL
jgi:cruciform cutting endonuclease 1